MPTNPTNRRRTNNIYFGIKIFEFDKFLLAIIGLIGFIGVVVYHGTKYYLKQDIIEQKHQAERECDNNIHDLKTQILFLEKSKDFATKDDVEKFESNLQRGRKNEK